MNSAPIWWPSRVEPLRADEIGDVVLPGDEEAAVGQRHDIRLVLVAAVVVLTRTLEGDIGGAVVGEDRRPNVGRGGAIGVGPHHDEAAVVQRGDIRIGFQPAPAPPKTKLGPVTGVPVGVNIPNFDVGRCRRAPSS